MCGGVGPGRVRSLCRSSAVQIVDRVGRDVVAVEHIGSAHTDAELALLLSVARDRLHAGQAELDLGLLPAARVSTDDVADWIRRGRSGGRQARR